MRVSTSPRRVPRASAAPAKRSGCRRYTSASVAITPVNEKVPEADIRSWERAVTAPMLECFQAAPDDLCLGSVFDVNAEIERFETGEVHGLIFTIRPLRGQFEKEVDMNALNRCVAAALPKQAVTSRLTRRLGVRVQVTLGSS
jgi:hypothetical protein